MIDPVHISDSTIYGSAWSTPPMRALFSERNKIHGWLEIMSTLADVQAEFDLIPAEAAREIEACRHIEVDDAFLREAGEGFAKTNHSLLGIINALKARLGPQGGEWLCYGVTVQDITDTQTMRTLMKVREHFIEEIEAIEQGLIDLAARHRDTPMCGRTHGQPGLPITFGFKAACWLDEMDRHRWRLDELGPRLGVGQLAGGVGSLSSLGPNGLALQQTFLERLGLQPPLISWTSSRDRLAEWLNLLALITSTGDRIGQEIVQLQRPEIGELSEGFAEGTVGSITMPQKRNPEISEHLGTLSRVVRHHAAHMAENLVHSHERDGRSWKGEWAIIPDATLAAGKSLALLKQLLADLQVHGQRMRTNIDASRGFIYSEQVMLALAKKIGKQSAHQTIYNIAMHAYEQGLHLKQALHNDPRITGGLLTAAEIEALFDLGSCTGQCAEMVERVIRSIRLPGRP
jgi:adenylosuccinate lyase